MAEVDLYRDYFSRHPDVFAAYMATSLAYPVGAVAAPAIMGGLLEKIKKGVGFSNVKWRVALLLGIIGFIYLVNISQQYANVQVASSFRMEARQEILRRLMRSRAYRFHTVDIPETIYKLIEIPDAMVYMLTLFKEIGPAIATMIGILIYFTWLSAKVKSPTIGLFVLVAILIAWGTASYNAATSLPSLMQNTANTESLYNRCGDVLEVLPHTLAVAARAEEAARHSTLVGEHLHRVRETNNRMVNIQMGTGVAMVVIVATVFGLLWKSHRSGALSPGVFTGSVFVLMCSRGVMWNLVTAVNPLLREYAHIHRLNDYFNELDAEAENAGAIERDAITVDPACVTPSLVFRNVTFSYSNSPLLSNVSFSLSAGSHTLVRGPVGSGKSTIGMLTIGLQQPTSGQVVVCGHDINTLSRRGISKLVSLIPAVPALLQRTVRENIQFGLSHRNFSDGDLIRALNTVGLDLPLDRNVGHRGEDISTGQRKLVYLAKAMLQNNPVIIADELTANLDPVTTGRVLQSLETVAAGKVLLFVSHDPPAGFRFDNTLSVSSGRINME